MIVIKGRYYTVFPNNWSERVDLKIVPEIAAACKTLDEKTIIEHYNKLLFLYNKIKNPTEVSVNIMDNNTLSVENVGRNENPIDYEKLNKNDQKMSQNWIRILKNLEQDEYMTNLRSDVMEKMKNFDKSNTFEKVSALKEWKEILRRQCKLFWNVTEATNDICRH